MPRPHSSNLFWLAGQQVTCHNFPQNSEASVMHDDRLKCRKTQHSLREIYGQIWPHNPALLSNNDKGAVLPNMDALPDCQ
jgi:hypothetical protein